MYTPLIQVVFDHPDVFVCGLLVLLGIISFISYQNRKDAWQELAARTKLDFIVRTVYTPIQVQGMYGGRRLRLCTYKCGINRNAGRTDTGITLQVKNDEDLCLEISRRSLFSSLRKVFPNQDFEIGDQRLDRRFIFNGGPEMAVCQLFNSDSLRAKLGYMPAQKLRLEGDTLTETLRGAVADIDLLQAQFDLLTEMANAIEGKPTDRSGD